MKVIDIYLVTSFIISVALCDLLITPGTILYGEPLSDGLASFLSTIDLETGSTTVEITLNASFASMNADYEKGTLYKWGDYLGDDGHWYSELSAYSLIDYELDHHMGGLSFIGTSGPLYVIGLITSFYNANQTIYGVAISNELLFFRLSIDSDDQVEPIAVHEALPFESQLFDVVKSTIDTENETFWAMGYADLVGGPYTLVGFDLSSGKLNGFALIDSLNLQSINYDPITKKLWGFGITESNERTLSYFDPETLLATVVAAYSNEQIPPIMNGPSDAFDPDTRLLSAIFAVDGSVNKLVSVNIDTGEVSSSVTLYYAGVQMRL